MKKGLVITNEEYKMALESFEKENKYRVIYDSNNKIKDLTKEPNIEQLIERVLELRNKDMVK